MGYFLCTILYIVIFPFLYILIVSLTNGILNDDNITNDFIDKMDNDLNYLDQKYDDLFDLINLFDPIYVELKRRNHTKYVEKLREENRKKRKEREKNTNLFKNWYY